MIFNKFLIKTDQVMEKSLVFMFLKNVTQFLTSVVFAFLVYSVGSSLKNFVEFE